MPVTLRPILMAPLSVLGCLVWAASPLRAETAALEIHIQDAEMIDWIVVRHAGGCEAVTGTLRIDFGPSAGGVVIDTEYGGGGTLHPRPVEVYTGPAEVLPPEDGARMLDVWLDALGPDAQAVLTLDMDSGGGSGGALNVVATGADIDGSVATFAAPGADGEAARGVFGPAGSAFLTVPCVPPGLV